MDYRFDVLMRHNNREAIKELVSLFYKTYLSEKAHRDIPDIVSTADNIMDIINSMLEEIVCLTVITTEVQGEDRIKEVEDYGIAAVKSELLLMFCGLISSILLQIKYSTYVSPHSYEEYSEAVKSSFNKHVSTVADSLNRTDAILDKLLNERDEDIPNE